MSTWLVVGLGNPGPQYAATRHNVGQMVIAELTERSSEQLSRHKTGNRVCETRLGFLPGGAPGPRAILATTTSYMNLSGPPIAALARFYDIPPERILVIHDDLDLPFGTLRLKQGGGEGGHNGLRSLSGALASRNYCRLRVGIGRPPGRMDSASYVLRPFTNAERPELAVTLVEAADAVTAVAVSGFAAEQQRLHTSR